MNIFVTDPDPFKSAANLDDARVIKMILESVQMLSTVARSQGKIPDGWEMYQPTHVGHPCVRWLQNEKNNVWWLIAHTYGLFCEYEERFNRVHASYSIYERAVSIFGYKKPNVLGFQNCARNKEHGIDFTHIKDVPTAYRLYLDARWEKAIRDHAENSRKKRARWTRRAPPEWYGGGFILPPEGGRRVYIG